MKAQEARVGARVAASGIHRIEERRGTVGTVAGSYGGDEYRAVDVRFPDGAQRLFWPQDLEETISGTASPRWWRLFVRGSRG